MDSTPHPASWADLAQAAMSEIFKGLAGGKRSLPPLAYCVERMGVFNELNIRVT
ncbi:hypothetical protein D3C71_2151900 [compost metagenome]